MNDPMATDPISDTQPEYVNESRFSHYRMQHAAHHHELDKTIKDYGLAFDTMRADIVALRAELKAVTEKLAKAPRSKPSPKKKKKQLTDLLKWSPEEIDADGLNIFSSGFSLVGLEIIAEDLNKFFDLWHYTEDTNIVVPNELASVSCLGRPLYEIVNEYWSTVQIAYNSQGNVYIAYQV